LKSHKAGKNPFNDTQSKITIKMLITLWEYNLIIVDKFIQGLFMSGGKKNASSFKTL